MRYQKENVAHRMSRTYPRYTMFISREQYDKALRMDRTYLGSELMAAGYLGTQDAMDGKAILFYFDTPAQRDQAIAAARKLGFSISGPLENDPQFIAETEMHIPEYRLKSKRTKIRR